MIGRVLGTSAGICLILLVLFFRGVPVLFFLKAIPLLILLIGGIVLIWASLSSD